MNNILYEAIWTTSASNYDSEYHINENPYIPCNKVNLFIGQNNTGKSRFIRSLFSSSEETLITLSEKTKSPHKEFIEEMLSTTKGEIDGIHRSYLEYLLNDQLNTISESNKRFEQLNEFINSLSSTMTKSGNQATHNWMICKQIFQNRMASLHYIKDQKTLYKSFYIPTLRGLRPIGEKAGYDLLKSRTHKDYFDASTDEKRIITGLDLYELFQRNLLGTPQQRALVKRYEKLLSDHFFEHKEVTIIPEYGKDTLAVKIGHEDQFPIYQLGDGLQQIIIITSSAFLNNDSSLFYIEEPETHLHPGMLRTLIDFLSNHTKHQYFITTHSNHLLDLSEEDSGISIFKLRKEIELEGANFKIENISECNDTLRELGVRPSSVYLSNSTIWIEGITDRLYLNAYIEKYLKYLKTADKNSYEKYINFKQNYHYTFVEYQGGTLGHWVFDQKNVDSNNNNGLNALKTCASAFLIADGDIRTKGERAEEIARQLPNRHHIINGKEIENTLPLSITLETVRKLFKSKHGKEDIKIDLIENLKYDHYNKDTKHGLGYWIDKTLGLRKKGDEIYFFGEPSGTVKDKVKFCTTATSIMNTQDWEITDEIIELCSLIFSHIEKNNT